MNPITKGLMKKFIEQHELESLKNDGDKFEHFTAFSILAPKRLANNSYKDGLTTRGEEGIDFVGILVNGNIITTPDEVCNEASTSKELDVEYIFIQAKISEKFEGDKIIRFTNTVRNFFDEDTNIGSSDTIAAARAVHKEVLKYASQFRTNPTFNAYYVTTGKVPEDNNTNGQSKYLKELEKNLRDKSLFSSINASFMGADEINAAYRSATTAVTSTIEFAQKVTLPEIDGIEQAYLGFLPITELLKLIRNDTDDSLRTHIFDDNVRDYQGDNTLANRGMKRTLLSKNSRQFAVMNNGITIVVRDLRVTGDQLTLTDFQIVNGAQTSNVIFRNRNQLQDSDIRVPVKLIQSNDENLITDVILATNSQTQVSATQLNARAKAERNIEKYFAHGDIAGDLHYERRKGQYDSNADIVKARVIDRSALVRSTASAFGNEPHTATGYQQDILKRLDSSRETDKRRYLQDNDEPIIYYAAASAYYKLDLYLKTGRIDPSYKPARWHLLHIARRIALKDEYPDFSNSKIRGNLRDFVNLLWDDDRCEKLFSEAVTVLDCSDVILNRESLRGFSATQTIDHAINRYKVQQSRSHA
ncbi:AIPR family protein [Corynebacterium jeikeium]|uniref:AIPR family protein n=1 Tax=Corynebacterium macclintockiae TaxID=2913501 RepID=UPI00054F12E4